MPLQGRIGELLDRLDARTSAYARHLASGAEVAVRADEPVDTLSVIKLPVLVLAFRDAEAGRLDLARPLRRRPAGSPQRHRGP